VYKALLYKTISAEELDTHVQTKVEALTRQKKAYQKADVIAHVTEELGIQHILNRVALRAVAVAGVGCSRVGDDMDMKSKMDIFLAAKETDAMSAEDSTLLAIVAVAEKVPANLEPLQISMRRRAR
jgi:phosphoglycerate dehydrogenase-like enzyme